MLVQTRFYKIVVTGMLLSLCIGGTATYVAAGAEKTSQSVGGASGSEGAPSTEIERGRYLATISNCKSCHTKEGGAPYAGGVKFETPYGIFFATNITPDAETGIGNWSIEEFRSAMRRGVRPDGSHLYPVFPYTAYTRMPDEDISAIFAFLKTVPSVDAPATPHEVGFPFNMNFLLAIWNWLYLDEGPVQADTTKSDIWNRGAYLVEGPGHCAVCHTPRNFLGGPKSDFAYTGGVFTDQVKTGDYRQWAATNLTSADTGLAAWSKDDLVDYLTTGVSRRAVSFGPMNDVVMNATRHLNPEDADAMATYLMSLAPIAPPVSEMPTEAEIAAGKSLYTVHCGTCHLPTGLGAEGKGGDIGEDLGVPLVGSAVVQASDPSSMINNILWGSDVPAHPFDSGRREMEAFALKMTSEEIAKLASYVRSAWGNQAGKVTAEQVERQR